MNNRIEFFGQTHEGTKISIDDIIGFFDHMIAAYDVLENVDHASINSITDNLNSSLRIEVESPDLAKLRSVVDYINFTLHNRKVVYGRSFIIDANINGSLVELYIRTL